VATVPLPPFAGGRRATLYTGNVLLGAKNARNRDGALALLDYLTSMKAFEPAAADWSITPPMPAAYATSQVTNLPNAATVKYSMRFAHPYPVSPATGAVMQAVADAVDSALSGELTPAEALQKGSAEVNAALAAAHPGNES
jgi:maltose-binding protein MalE